MTTAPETFSTYHELESALIAPDGPFAVTSATVAGVPMQVFRDTPESLGHAFSDLTSTYADSVLLIEDGVEYTYADVGERAQRLAAALALHFGIAPGDRVGILMKNQLSWVVSLMAIARCGGVGVLFNSRESSIEVGAALRDARCTVVIADTERATVVRSHDADIDIVLVGEGDLPSGSATRYADVVESVTATEHPLVVADPEDLCWILFTSGTSGRSKGVRLTQRTICTMVTNLRLIREVNIAANARKYGMDVDALRDFIPKLSALLIFPLFHTSGLVSLITTMTSGGFVVILNRWNPERAIELIARHKLAMLAGPPMVITDLLASATDPESVSSLVNISPAGQATTPDLVARISSTLPAAGRSVGWGMTETAGSVCTAGGDLLAAFPESSGMVSPVMRVRVVDADGHELAAGEVGELEVSGPLVMAGYLDRPDETAAVFDGSWYRSGDLGYLDDHGLVYVVDRKKDMVISAGENIYCAEIEYALMATDLFSEVAVFGVPDERRGEAVMAVVNTHDGRQMTVAEVQDSVRERLAAYKIPEKVVFADAPLPRNATGKVVKRRIRDSLDL